MDLTDNDIIDRELIVNEEIMTLNADELRFKLRDVDDPEWFLDLLGLTMEETHDYDEAMTLASAAYDANPIRPSSQEDMDAKRISDALALQDYVDSATLFPSGDEEPAPGVNTSQPASSSPVNVTLHVHQPGQQSHPINIVNEVPPQPIVVEVQPAQVTNVVNVPSPKIEVSNVVNVPEPKPVVKTAVKDADGKWTVKEKVQE